MHTFNDSAGRIHGGERDRESEREGERAREIGKAQRREAVGRKLAVLIARHTGSSQCRDRAEAKR